MHNARVRITPKLIDSLYTEAMVLADEARAYFDRQGRDERLELDPVVRVGFSCESLKVTTRLMHIIAWLLTQKAVEAGELSQSQARAPQRRLGEAAESDRRADDPAAAVGAAPCPGKPGPVRARPAPRRRRRRGARRQPRPDPDDPARALALKPRSK